MLARIILFVISLAFLGYGVWTWFNPEGLAEILLIAPPYSVEFMSEARATYGGFQAAIGLVMLYAAISGRNVITTCCWVALFMSALVIGRSVDAMMLQEMPHGYVLQALIFEWVSVILLGLSCLWGRSKA